MHLFRALVAAAILAMALLTAGAADAQRCIDNVKASGSSERDIEDATRSAFNALESTIRNRYGADYSIGSRRSATYTCVKPMGGQPRYIKWTCTLEANACRSGNSQPPPPSAAYIERLHNRYVEGEGYDTLRCGDHRSCFDACMAESRCRLVEFHKPTGKCNLFGRVPTLKQDSGGDAIIGIKR